MLRREGVRRSKEELIQPDGEFREEIEKE